MSDLQESPGVECVGYDSARRMVTGSLGSVHLPPISAVILRVLLVHTGEIVSRERLYAACWPDPNGGPNGTIRENLGVQITHLRARLVEAGYPGKIKTLWGVGYFLIDDPRPTHVLHLIDSHHRLMRYLLETHPNQRAAGLLLPMFDA